MAVTLALGAGAVLGLQALWFGWITPSAAAAEAALPQIELVMTPDPRIAHGLHTSLNR
jgi:hypothetical protein